MILLYIVHELASPDILIFIGVCVCVYFLNVYHLTMVSFSVWTIAYKCILSNVILLTVNLT